MCAPRTLSHLFLHLRSWACRGLSPVWSRQLLWPSSRTLTGFPMAGLEQLLPSVWLSLHYSCFLTEIFGSTSHSRQWALLRVEVGSASCFVPRCLTTAKCTLAYKGAYKEALMVEWMNEWLNEIFPCFAVPRVWICSGIQLPMWILLRSILGLKSVSFQSYYVYNVSWWKLIEIPPLRPPLIYISYIL